MIFFFLKNSFRIVEYSYLILSVVTMFYEIYYVREYESFKFRKISFVCCFVSVPDVDFDFVVRN